jgi:hypothetical protein
MSHQPTPEAVAQFILRKVQASGMQPIDGAETFQACREVFPMMSMETFAESLGLAAHRINEAVAEHRAQRNISHTLH